MTEGRSVQAQSAVDFLANLKPAEVDLHGLAGSADYSALVELARAKGIETDEESIREAFALIMRARLVASQLR